MKILTPVLLSLGSCAAGFFVAALTVAPLSPAAGRPAARTTAPASAPPTTAPDAGARAEAVLAEIAAGMAGPDAVEAAKRWAGRDPYAFLSWTRTTRLPLPPEATCAFFDAWSARDPKAAFAALARQHFNVPPFQTCLRGEHVRLYETNPLTALGLPEVPVNDSAHKASYIPELRCEFSPALLEALDPAKVAATLRAEHTAGSLSGQFIAAYLDFLMARSSDTAFAWLATVPPEVAGYACKTLVNNTAATSAADALRLLDRLPAEFHAHLNTRDSLARELVEAAPREYLLWLHARTSRIPRDVQEILSTGWFKADRAAATEWIAANCQPTKQQELFEAAARTFRSDEPAAALTWALNLPPGGASHASARIAATLSQDHLLTLLECLVPQEGKFTPGQLGLLSGLSNSTRDMSGENFSLLEKWSHSPANVSGYRFVK